MQTLKIMLTLTVSQIDWIMNLWEWKYLCNDQQENKKRSQTTQKDKSNEAEIEILTNM